MQNRQDVINGDVTEKNILPSDSDQDSYFDTYETIHGSDLQDENSRPLPSIYVDATASPGGDGSMEWPFDTIQQAIDAAIDFDIIQLANGTYVGPENKNLNFHGKLIMLRSEHGPETCLIDCEGNGRGVLFEQKENGFSVLWGISILNGDVFEEDGGAIHSRSTSPTIQNCLFLNNVASRGGAIFLEASSPRIQDSFILSNMATSSGGGIYSDATSDPLIENTLIEDNVPDQMHDLFQYEPETIVAANNMLKDFDDNTEAVSPRATPTRRENNLLDPVESNFRLDDLDKIRDIKTINNNEPFPIIPILIPADTDGDGLPNQWELSNLLNPNDSSDAMTDPDGDGFGNAYEFFHKTDPRDRGSAPSPTLFVKKLSMVPVPSPLKSLSPAPNPFPSINPQPNPFPNPLPQPIPTPAPTPLFYTKIQPALDAATDFDIIEVANGIFTGTGNKNLDYQGKPIILLSKNGPEHTVIDCEGSGRGFRFFNGEDKRSVLRGVTIKNGLANHGAGISCEASSPTIQECVILHNHALQEGGGLYNDSSSPLLINLILAQNQAQAGGAIFNGKNASPAFHHCTLADNTASSVGGGLGHLDDSSTPEVHSTILWGNRPEQVDHLGDPVITFSDIQGGWVGQNNIDADPQLTALYHLKSTSPCINGGRLFGFFPQLDIDGEDRVGQFPVKLSFNVDIGADEFVDTDRDGLPDHWENEHFGDLSHDGTEDNDSAGGADGLSNLSEYENGTDPNKSDTDGDGLLDGDEIAIHGTSPTNSDTDGDGLPDGWEIDNRLNPNDPSDRMSDLDQDGFGNLYEFFHRTNPRNIRSTPSSTIYVYPYLILPVGPQPTFRTIQAALDAATDYDIIELADGTYTGVGNKDLNYRGKSVMLLSKNGPSDTVIDCERSGRGFRFFNGEDERSILRGVTIKNGRADRGAGISCESSSPTFQDCVILRNHAAQEGGGLHNDSSSPMLVNVIVAQNQAPVGGAIFNGTNTSLFVQNCTIADNITSSGGGIAHLNNTAISDIVNSILWGNTPKQIDTNGRPVIVYSDIQGGWTGQGNINSDPQLTALYRLKATSPCINAGNLFAAPSKDIDGEIRIGLLKDSIGVDIGADEFVDTDIDGLSDDWEMNFFGDLTHNAAEDSDRVGGPDGLSNLAEYENGTDPNKSDTDGDGLEDGDEVNSHGTSPIDADIDNDGLNDSDEIRYKTKPYDPDSDGDGLEDGEEIRRGTLPNNSDTDGDGIDDGTEVANRTDPNLSLDFDQDGLPDDWETHYGLSSKNPDASEDPDGDGLTNLEEYNAKTDPKNFDTDGDFLPDKFELDSGFDPTTWDNPKGDADGDGLSNLDEVIYSTHPKKSDTDGDGVNDKQEVDQGSDPTDNSDGGKAPPPEELVEIELIIGDHSDSHSERYNLIVGPITHQAPQFGVLATNTYKFKRGKTYDVTVRHTGSKEKVPDYDYTAVINVINPEDCVYVEDPEGILGRHNEGRYFFAKNKKAYLHFYDFDVDIDSDNDDHFETPSRTDQEDEIEEIQNDHDAPGKMVGANDGDWDDDGTPDFADGFSRYANNPSDNFIEENRNGDKMRFVPMVVEIPEPFDLNLSTIKFTYSASDPNEALRSGAGTDADPYTYSPATGHLRVWTKDAPAKRNPAEVGLLGGGNFIQSDQEYSVSELGPGRILTVYVEGIQASASVADQSIRVQVDPTGPNKEPGFICEDVVNTTIFSATFVNNGEEEVKLSTSFSHPNPIVQIGIGKDLADITLGDIVVNHSTTTATVHIHGKVISPIADIVENGAADIREVTIEGGALTPGTTNAVVRIPVKNVSVVDISEYRPYRSDSDQVPHPFEGRFEADVEIPLRSGENSVIVGAVNAIGNDGYDSFSIRVEYSEPGMDVTGVTNNESTEPGSFHPIWVYLKDPSVTVHTADTATASLFGNTFPLTIHNGQLRIERPFIQVGSPLMPGVLAENILNVETHPDLTTMLYKGLTRDLSWNYTAQSPPKKYYYAAGTTVKVKWYDSKLKNGWKVDQVTPYEREGFTWWFSGEVDDDCEIQDSTLTPIRSTNGQAGVEFEMKIKTSALKHPTKSFHIEISKGTETKKLKWVGEFGVVPLKTFIIAVDGLGFESAADSVKKAPTFKKVFEGYLQHENGALAALPTITFCNWPGIFSGNSPAVHGWVGNSWFPRETTNTNRRFPFVSSNVSGKLARDSRQNTGIVTGGEGLSQALPDTFSMPDRTLDNPGSLYDMVAKVATSPINKLKAFSVLMYYDHNTNGSVKLADTHYGSRDTGLSGHSPDVALKTDRHSSKKGLNNWKANRQLLDILTLYLPGPDNVAHYIGAMTGDPTGNPPGTAPPGYTAGKIGEVTKPLPSLLEQVVMGTDSALQTVIDKVEKDGYLNACLFVLIADHGLIAFRNTDDFNITSADQNGLELQLLFDTPVANGGLGMPLWRDNGLPGFKVRGLRNSRAVYSPNGGMSQIYLRSDDRTWQQPPLNADVEAAASLLYREAIGYPGQLYPGLAPRPASPGLPAIPETQGALGKPPAIFVRYGGTDGLDAANNNFMRDFKWVKGVGNAPQFKINVAPIADFIKARKTINGSFDWPAFEARVKESNHKNLSGSRTGDILLVMDVRAGYLTVNQDDRFNGWHGGPTVAESKVPMMFNMPGSALVTLPKETNPTFVHKGFEDYVKGNLKADGYLRSYQMPHVLTNIIKQVRSTADPKR